MDFFEKVGETITIVGKEAVDKTKSFAEIANLKSQIHACDEVIKKNYGEIGSIYYDNFGSNPEEIFVKQCKAIANAEEAKVALEEQLKELKEQKSL